MTGTVTCAPETRTHSPIRLPRTIAEVDRAWLEQALRQQRPDISVHQAQLLQSLGGACTKLRMALQTNDPDFPETVIVKGCFEPHSQAMVPNQLGEALAYARIVPSLPELETISCFFVQADAEEGSALIMEDLARRGADCLDARQPIASFALAADALDSLARLHARWWNAPELGSDGPFGFTAALEQLTIPSYDAVLADPAALQRTLSQPRGSAVSTELHDGPRLLAGFHAARRNDRGLALVLAHGDPHLSNLYVTADGRAGLLDWTCLRVPWAFDVAYFMAGCLDVTDRRRWEQPLLQHYLSCLARNGASAPGFDDAWDGYRDWLVWGLYVWLLNVPAYHSEENITAMAYRFGAAMIDHEVFSHLGV